MRPASFTLFPPDDSGRQIALECSDRHARTILLEAQLLQEYRPCVLRILEDAGVQSVDVVMDDAIGRSTHHESFLLGLDETQDRLVLIHPEPVFWNPGWGDYCPSDCLAWNGCKYPMAFQIRHKWSLDYAAIIKSLADKGKVLINEDLL